MDIVGVVAEYNPFHLGHRYHLSQIRRLRPGCVIVCAMSGNWVQRGECAVTDKWRRALWAVRGGADLVVELPTPWAVSSAEPFARGAVSLLRAAGANTISFGCETPDVGRLTALAQALDSPQFPAALAPCLRRGLPFPAARQKAAAKLLGEETARLLEGPNNNLAVEYLRAGAGALEPLPILRRGSHDGPLEAPFPSAAALRELLRRGELSRAEEFLPQPWDGPVCRMSLGERAVLARLRAMSLSDWEAVPDTGDGLAPRLFAAAGKGETVEEVCALAKSRHLTLSRVRRAVLGGFLGLTAQDRPAAPPYLRVLAMTPAGRAHLARLKRACPLPILTKPAQARELLAQEARLTDLFGLFAPHVLPKSQEFLHSPVLWEPPSLST